MSSNCEEQALNRLSWSDVASRQHYSSGQALLTRYISQPVGGHLAALACRLGITPNQLTLLGLLLMLAACVFYIQGSPRQFLLAGLLWQLGFAFDCADGQLARATGRAGPVGGWLDVACDYIRQAAIALAILWLLLDAGVPQWLGWLSCLVLLCGLNVYLFTATLMKVEQPPAMSSSGVFDHLRNILRFVLDTPLFLFLICLLAPEPLLLTAYVTLYGALLVLRAIGIVRMRMAG